MPAFFALLVLAQSLTTDFLPEIYTQYGDGTRVALIAGTALLVGLLLLGLNYPIFRAFEGYPLRVRRDRAYVKWLHDLLVARRRKRYTQACATRDSDASVDEARARAAWRLDLYFPDNPASLLPTRFGNAVLAFERHSVKRWGLDSIPVWPRIQLLLSEREGHLEANAQSNVAFLINGSLLASACGIVLLVDAVLNRALEWSWLFYLIPFALSYLLYHWGVGAATRWGSVIRAAIDVHRLALYEELGVRHPVSFSEERDIIGPAVSGSLLYGYAIPDALRAGEASTRERGQT